MVLQWLLALKTPAKSKWLCRGHGNSALWQTPQTVYSYEYDAAGRLYAVTDHLSGQATLFRYNAAGQLLQSYVYDTQTHSNLLEVALEYDAQQRLSRVSHFFGYATESVES